LLALLHRFDARLSFFNSEAKFVLDLGVTAAELLLMWDW